MGRKEGRKARAARARAKLAVVVPAIASADIDPETVIRRKLALAEAEVKESELLLQSAKANHAAAVRQGDVGSISAAADELRLRGAQFRAADQELSAQRRQLAGALGKTW